VTRVAGPGDCDARHRQGPPALAGLPLAPRARLSGEFGPLRAIGKSSGGGFEVRTGWTKAYRRWLTTVRFDHPAQQIVLQERGGSAILPGDGSPDEHPCRGRRRGPGRAIDHANLGSAAGLCQLYRHLMAAGKPKVVATTAIAREMAGFIWAIARTVTTDPARAAVKAASQARTSLGPADAQGRGRNAVGHDPAISFGSLARLQAAIARVKRARTRSMPRYMV